MEDGSGPSPAKAGEVQSFDWRQYLAETESTTPPLTVFYHNTEQVPENKFQLGQLILVPDKKAYVMVLAKIVRVHKCWVQYQLLGLRDKNLVWVMCDDSSMQPIEPVGDTSDPLTRGAFPVTGFQLTNFRKWAAKLYEQNEDKIVPPEDLAPLSQSFYPIENKFEKGMKVAVLDQNSFIGNLLVGTVVDIEKETNLRVEFDGYDQFTVLPYDSRDLFPFEYLDKIGVFLEAPPKTIATPKRKRAPKKEQPLAAVVQPEIEVITVEDDVEVIEVVEKPPIKRRSPAGNLGKRSWQKTSVMRERMTGVTDKVADILKKAQADLIAAEQKKTPEKAEKGEPRVAAVKKAYLLPSTSRAESTHCNIIPVLQSGQPLQTSRMLHPVKLSPQVRLVPSPAPVPYRQTVVTLPGQTGKMQYVVPSRGGVVPAQSLHQPGSASQPIVLDMETSSQSDGPAPSSSHKMTSPPQSVLMQLLLSPVGQVDAPPLSVSISPTPSVTAECPSLSPFLVDRPASPGANEYVKFVYSQQCRVPPSLITERVRRLYRHHPPLDYPSGVRVVLYDLLDCSVDLWALFDSLDSASVNESHIQITCRHQGRKRVKLVAIPNSKERAILWVKQLATSIGCCENFVSTSKIRCANCTDPNDPIEEDEELEEIEQKDYCWEDRLIFPKYGLTPLNNEEVAKAFEDELGPEVARMVKERASVSFAQLAAAEQRPPPPSSCRDQRNFSTAARTTL